MTTTYHNPIATGAAANAATFNTPFSQLDSRLVQLDTVMDTDGSLKTNAVDATVVLADNIITNIKLVNGTIDDSKFLYPIRIAWAGVGFDPGSLTAGGTYTVTYDLGASGGNLALINRYGTDTATVGLIFDAWMHPTSYYVYVRVTNATNGTLAPGTINALVAVLDLAGGLTETTESVVT